MGTDGGQHATQLARVFITWMTICWLVKLQLELLQEQQLQHLERMQQQNQKQNQQH